MRPDFKEIKIYEEFNKYYWYLEELKEICKNLQIDYSGTKKDLNDNVKEYFKGNLIKKTRVIKIKPTTDIITLDTKLLECGFCFNQKFRDFFIKQTGVKNFKFNTDMVAISKKVKADKDFNFTLKDMLDVYYGELEYAKYDNSSCEWNKFLKDFCSDKNNNIYKDKLKVATILWKEVRNSTNKKIYTSSLLEKYSDKIKNMN